MTTLHQLLLEEFKESVEIIPDSEILVFSIPNGKDQMFHTRNLNFVAECNYGDVNREKLFSKSGFRLPARYFYSSGMLYPYGWKTYMISKKSGCPLSPVPSCGIYIGLDPDEDKLYECVHGDLMRILLVEYRARVKVYQDNVPDRFQAKSGGLFITLKDECSWDRDENPLLLTYPNYPPYLKVFTFQRADQPSKQFDKWMSLLKERQEQNRLRWYRWIQKGTEEESRRFGIPCTTENVSIYQSIYQPVLSFYDWCLSL